MHLFLLNFILLGISSTQIIAEKAFCTTTVACIEKIKRIVPETDRFWFGDQHKLHCEGRLSPRLRVNNAINCINPPDLVNYNNFGSRLFRVKTFTSAYLQNLRIFPRILYKPTNGSYRACDHNFDVESEVEEIDGQPDMEPVDPYFIRNPPDISWPELNQNDSLFIAMVDVGFGTLRFLSIDYPRDTKVIRKYQPVENFRKGMPTPMALLIFRPPPGMTYNAKSFKGHPDEPFDLPQFMIKHGLESGLIGLNWLMVGADAYAIERRRIRGFVDNCHSLIQTKLLKDQRWDFVDAFPLNELDSSLSVSFTQPEVQGEVCCSKIELIEDEIFADPLSDRQISSVAAKNIPKLSSLRSVQNSDNYQRSLRHYIVSKEDRFTVVMFDPKKQYLYWMVTDIPSAALAAGEVIHDGLTVANYMISLPDKPNDCQFVVLMLFRQPRSAAESDISEHYNNDHPLRSKMCNKHCVYRSLFNIEKFKSFHRLTLSSISWFKVCYDIYEASQQIIRIEASNFTKSPDDKWKPNQYARELARFNEQRRIEMENICALIRQTNLDCAKLSSASRFSVFSFYILILLYIFC